MDPHNAFRITRAEPRYGPHSLHSPGGPRLTWPGFTSTGTSVRSTNNVLVESSGNSGLVSPASSHNNGEIAMPDMQDVRSFLVEENGLAVVSTAQGDGRVLSSVVNCGVVGNPITGTPCVAFVSRGGAARLGHVRRGVPVTVAVRRGWNWVSVTGPAVLIGPDELPEGIDGETLRLLLREVFQAAGGTHDDYDEYDRAMAEDARVAVLVAPDRIHGVTS